MDLKTKTSDLEALAKKYDRLFYQIIGKESELVLKASELFNTIFSNGMNSQIAKSVLTWQEQNLNNTIKTAELLEIRDKLMSLELEIKQLKRQP